MEDLFVCKHPNVDAVKFVRTKDGLYIYKPTKNYIQDVRDAEAMLRSEKNFKSFMENAGAIAKFGKNYNPTMRDAEAMPKFQGHAC